MTETKQQKEFVWNKMLKVLEEKTRWQCPEMFNQTRGKRKKNNRKPIRM